MVIVSSRAAPGTLHAVRNRLRRLWRENGLAAPPAASTPSSAGAQAAARSKHAGGINVARVDGSVEFQSELTDLALWRGMATMVGGEPAPNTN